MFPDVRVLVTGSSGVIGSALVEALRAAGVSDVVAATSQDVDLADAYATEKYFAELQPEIVFHLAARVYGIMGNLSNRADAYLQNVRINTNVVDAAMRAGCRKFVAMGSTAIYADTVPLPMSEDDIFRDRPHASEAAYAHAKRAMLAQLEAYQQQYGMDYAFAISTNLFGPRDRFDEQWGHVIPSLVSRIHRAKSAAEPLMVWGTGSPRRDLLFSRDAADALLLIATEHTGPINLASGATWTIREVVETLAAVADFAEPVQWDSTKPDGQMQRDYDISRLGSLGFKPATSLESGLRMTYEWYQAAYPNVRR